MKYLVDQNKIITEFSKHLLSSSDDMDSAVALLLRDVMYELKVEKVDMTNRLSLVSIFQDIFEVLNPIVNNIFSAFDIDFYGDEDVNELTSFMIRFMNEWTEIRDEIYRDEVIVEYNIRSL